MSVHNYIAAPKRWSHGASILALCVGLALALGCENDGPMDGGSPPGDGMQLCTSATCMNARDCPLEPPTVGATCVPFAGSCHYCSDGDLTMTAHYTCTEFEPYSMEMIDCE